MWVLKSMYRALLNVSMKQVWQGLKIYVYSMPDAIQVLREMPDNSINCVQLYFPDPWQRNVISNAVLLFMAYATGRTKT